MIRYLSSRKGYYNRSRAREEISVARNNNNNTTTHLIQKDKSNAMMSLITV